MSRPVQGGNDELTGGDNFGSGIVSNPLFGDALRMLGSSQGGKDTLAGGDNFGSGNVRSFRRRLSRMIAGVVPDNSSQPTTISLI
jgi:hypothetical protein